MDSTSKESPDCRVVLRELSNVKNEPISPTANLRLLTTLASNLKSAPQNNKHDNKITRRSFASSRESESDPFKLKPRKEKSLGLLCNKFLSIYPLSKASVTPQEISLDVTAKALGTEKRRIYDIINVLESLEMASKAGKNRYLWHGNSFLPGTLAKLKSLGVKLGLREQIQGIQKINRAFTTRCNDESPVFYNALVSQSPNLDSSLSDSNSKEDKSLGVMCQKFIMLFLVSLKNGVVNLDIAAKVLITDNAAEQSTEVNDNNVRSRFKTKVRRLYDIANVLTAIGLIKKVSVADSSIRKPIFQYTGPDVDYIDFDADTPVRESTRHSLIGMATPSRSFTYSSVPLSCSSNQRETPNRLSIGTTTPITKRREPRKRKLFGTDEKFGRTISSPCLEVDRHLDRLDDSILQVAEMELEKLKSIEQPKSKACVKLFPRHNSESCVSATQVSGEFKEALKGKISAQCNLIEDLDAKKLSSQSGTNLFKIQPDFPIGFESPVTIGNENLVQNLPAFNATNNRIEISTLNSSPCCNISNLNVHVSPVSLLPSNADVRLNNKRNMKTLKLKVRDPNIITIKNVGSKKFVVKDIVSENTKTVRIAPYNIQPKICTPKFVSLANFDAKKLIPIKSSDFMVSGGSLQPIVLENPNYAILTQVQTPVLSPGDLFKAVQVGNTLQLVPLSNNHKSAKFNNEIDNQSNENNS